MPGIRETVVLAGLIAWMGFAAEAVLGQEPAVSPRNPFLCEGPEVDRWVTDFRDRITAYHGLAHFASEQFGSPTGCQGRVTTEFDGMMFGILVLKFAEGLSLEVETFPPETTVTTLRTAWGFDDETLVREALRAHAADTGLAVDWTTPEVTMDGNEEVHTFWDPEPGLNASASLIYRNSRLVAVRLSMAL